MATVNSRSEIGFRLGLAQGFLREAVQDLELERWRSCVDNSQLAVENTGKAVLGLFGVPPKTHDPAAQVAALLRKRDLVPSVAEILRRLLPDLIALGSAEHVLTDYGDEATYTLPWDLFSRESAEEALAAARRAVEEVDQLVNTAETNP